MNLAPPHPPLAPAFPLSLSASPTCAPFALTQAPVATPLFVSPLLPLMAFYAFAFPVCRRFFTLLQPLFRRPPGTRPGAHVFFQPPVFLYPLPVSSPVLRAGIFPFPSPQLDSSVYWFSRRLCPSADPLLPFRFPLSTDLKVISVPFHFFYFVLQESSK